MAGTGRISGEDRGRLVRPLALGLCDGAGYEQIRKALQDRLAQAVINRNYTVATGFLSTPFVLGELTRMGRSDLAYRMLKNEQQPGWLYEVKQGATTIWENWEGTGSHNHYSPGAVCKWLFDTVVGIIPSGERQFVIAPVPGGSLTSARAYYDSIYGRVESCWERKGNRVSCTVNIPSNVTAEICLPDRDSITAESGTHQFTWKLTGGTYGADL